MVLQQMNQSENIKKYNNGTNNNTNNTSQIYNPFVLKNVRNGIRSYRNSEQNIEVEMLNIKVDDKEMMIRQI